MKRVLSEDTVVRQRFVYMCFPVKPQRPISAGSLTKVQERGCSVCQREPFTIQPRNTTYRNLSCLSHQRCVERARDWRQVPQSQATGISDTRKLGTEFGYPKQALLCDPFIPISPVRSYPTQGFISGRQRTTGMEELPATC
jgi:hypothetical protein